MNFVNARHVSDKTELSHRHPEAWVILRAAVENMCHLLVVVAVQLWGRAAEEILAQVAGEIEEVDMVVAATKVEAPGETMTETEIETRALPQQTAVGVSRTSLILELLVIL
jgi:Flp pilus assembly protein CpaB